LEEKGAFSVEGKKSLTPLRNSRFHHKDWLKFSKRSNGKKEGRASQEIFGKRRVPIRKPLAVPKSPPRLEEK